MRLQRKPPLGMLQSIAGRRFDVGALVRIVHRLQKEVFEILIRIALRRAVRLRIDQLQFVAIGQLLFGIGLGTDADPIDARRRP